LGQRLLHKLYQWKELERVNDIIVIDIEKVSDNDRQRYIGVEFLNYSVGTGQLHKLEQYWKKIRNGTIFFVAACASTELSLEKAYKTNVQGVEELLSIAQLYGAKAFVLTSTHNVVFNGTREWFHQDESIPIVDNFMDVYSQTKAESERITLGSNGIWNVHTCALRPGGIYGAGEKVHFERIRKLAQLGLLYFLISPVVDKNMDFCHVDNLVDAHILAAQQLQFEASHPETPTTTSGNAFFITENDPQCLQTFYIPVLLASGISPPLFTLHIPRKLVYPFAVCTEWIAKHWPLGPAKPILMPMELLKSTMVHTFSYEKATKAFGYVPRKSIREGIEEWCRYEQQRHRIGNENKWNSSIFLRVIVVILWLFFFTVLRQG